MEKIDTSTIFQGRSELIDWLIGTASANWGIPFEVSQPFFTDVVEKMLELDPTLLNQDGTISLSQPRIHVIAR